MRGARHSYVGGGALVILAVSCTEFLRQPTLAPTVIPAGTWPAALSVKDSQLLVLSVTLPDGTEIVGLQVSWQSSNPAVLEIEEQRPGIVSRLDSLTVQLGAMARGRARGSAQVTVQIEGPPELGFAEYSKAIVVLERWKAASAGGSHSCAIAADSSAFCWGAGSTGALGNGGVGNSPMPMPVFAFAGLNKFLVVSAGEQSSCGIIAQNVVHCWGQGSLGQLGNGSQATQYTPVIVSLGRAFLDIRAGQTACGVTPNNRGFCWGSNSDSQLGAPVTGAGFDQCGVIACSLTPRAVRAFADTVPLSAIDVATFHTCGISNNAVTLAFMYCWGTGTIAPGTSDTIFLLGDSVYGSRSPILVAPPSGTTQHLAFRSVGTGERHTCGITLARSAYCWGASTRGQLGNNGTAHRAKPVLVAGGIQFDSITAGNAHSCGLASSGDAYCWGANEYGQLGVDSNATPDRLAPALVSGGLKFTSLNAGQFHTCGITTTHAVYCWGRNTSGQLGTTLPVKTCTVGALTTSCSRVPVRVSEPDP